MSQRSKRQVSSAPFEGRYSPDVQLTQRVRRCGKCSGCKREEDCGSCTGCHAAAAKKATDGKQLKAGRVGRRTSCLLRKCRRLIKASSTENEQRLSSSRSSFFTSSAEATSTTSSDKAVVFTENETNCNVLKNFQPSAYLLLQDEQHGPIQKRSYNQSTDHTNDGPPKSLYGLPILSVSRENVCSVCLLETSDEFDEKNPILLCDGCDREYHLQCMRPLYYAVPEGDFYCWNCMPTGTTTSLHCYLDKVDEARLVYESRSEYIAELRKYMIADNSAQSRSTKRQRSASDVDVTFPHPELDLAHVYKIHVAATADDNESSEEDLNVAATPDLLIGKPLDLSFQDEHGVERFHSGRIVDYRETSEQGIVEYLVRFAAGSDFRKTGLSHWMVLEEHVITVGVEIVWIEERKTQWLPAIVQLRTVLCLLVLKNFEKKVPVDEPDSPQRHSYRGTVHTKREKITVWTRTFGERPGLIQRDLKSQTMKFQPNESGALSQLAAVEWYEQERVRRWWQMKQVQPFGYRALSSRDEDMLEPLIPINHAESGFKPHAALCPLVSRGLDRLHLVELMKQRGEIEPKTKDVAATLSCKILSMSSSLSHHSNVTSKP